MNIKSNKRKNQWPLTSSACVGNIELSEKIISQVINIHGVKTFCICPGGRSAPLVSVISHVKGLEVFSFFDERSAGFFALGRCKRDKRPCAVVTTSGTAVAELLPSVIEAYYSHLPLVLVTADRPSSYRKTGAPQSIEQPGIFSHYVEEQWDLEKNLEFDLSSWKGSTPCHINVCFDEPLINKEVNKLSFSSIKEVKKKLNSSSPKEEQQIKSFFHKVKNPLCILTELPDEVRENTENILYLFRWPVYAEALSGLRESEKLNSLLLKSGSDFLNWIISNQKADGIIRIGRRPSARFWRDLEKNHLPVLSVSDQIYSGLSRGGPALSFDSFFQWSKDFILSQSHIDGELFTEDKKRVEQLQKTLEGCPFSEPSLIREFSRKIPDHSLLFLGNSLPIREWDLAADYGVVKNKQLKYLANRGANGIDGLLSTFFGACKPDRQNWCLIGDLSCLYDLSAPWVLQQMNKSVQCFIVVINNSGGQIFSSMFSDPLFLNSHNLQFKQWAAMWNLNYYCVTQWPETFSFSSPAIIELKVNPTYTKQFHSLLKAKTLLSKEKTGLD